MNMTLVITTVTIIAFFGGWFYAHKVIADECEKLGGFYVGSVVYRCIKIESQNSDE